MSSRILEGYALKVTSQRLPYDNARGARLIGGKQYRGKYRVVQTSLDTTGSMLNNVKRLCAPYI